MEFLPALRGAADGAESKALVPATETKTLLIPGYSSTTTFGGGGGWSGGTRADSWDMDRVIGEGYERVVWVFRCVELISGHASRLPFQIGRNIGTDVEERLAAHPLYRVLNKQANPMERGRHFRKRLSAQLLLSKKGVFVEVQKSQAGTIVRLDLLDPGRVRIVEDEFHGDYIKHFEYTRRDGVVREIDPAKIRWIREPHPTDPFSGTTPLEAGGMSVQLDFLSRLYNVSFITNDSRPGGILGVDADTLDDQEMDRIERKFKPGAHHAGEMTVIGTGPGGMNYVDSTTKPRDMAYGEMAANAKNEVLSAFGIGESLLGNAAGRTYDNAESELYGFWTQVMPSHLELIAGAFEQDIGEEWDPFLDTSGIEVLELPRRRDREEALREFNAGLRSIDEYRPLAKLKPIGLAQTRALWISPAKAPVPTRPEDAAALGMEAPGAPAIEGAPAEGDESAAAAVAEAQQLAAGEAPAQIGGSTAADAVREAQETAAGVSTGTEGEAAAAVAEAMTMSNPTSTPGDAQQALDEARRTMEGKALDPGAPRTGPETIEHDPSEQEAAAAELAVAAALAALLARQQGVVQARLDSPRYRKGTKFWTAEGPKDTRGGDAPLDADDFTQSARWQQETVDTLSPVVMPAAATAAGALLTAMAAGGAIATTTDAAEISALAAKLSVSPALVAVAAAANAMSELVNDLSQAISTEALVTDSTEQIKATVRDFFAQHADEFARNIATTVALSAVNGARDAAANALLGMPGADGEVALVVATWQTRRDSHVRPEHAATQGKSVVAGEPFDMDGHKVRFPQDPMAPPYLIYGCRCHLSYRIKGSGKFLLPPTNEV